MIEWFFLWLFSFWSDSTISPETVPATTTAQVVRVIDGDTIDVRFADESKARVRYIGIDTPEPYAGTAPECYASEATTANEQLVAEKAVELVSDQEDRDRYGRLLRYVYVDGELVNEKLLAEGFATTLTIPPNTRFAERFARLEATARNEERGLWAVCR